MRIADIRSVIDAAAWRIRDLQGHTLEEFMCANVHDSMGRHIVALKTLDIPDRFAHETERRDYLIGACERMIERWFAAKSVNVPGVSEPKCTTVYIVPAWSDQAGQCRIVARKGLIPDPRSDYAENPGCWFEIGLMSSSGQIRCIQAPAKVYEELRHSEPLAAGNVFQFNP